MLEPFEQQALDYAGEMAAEYIESIGVTDITKMSVYQWKIMIEVIAINYSQKRAELQPCPF